MNAHSNENQSDKEPLKIVVIGGSGLIGTQVVNALRARGHEVVAASPSKGVNAVTGEGLAVALAGAKVVVDVSNSPSFADQAALDFFTCSAHNLAAAEVAAGVRHHVAVSVVGTERVPTSGYFRAKLAYEGIVQAAKTPYTIVKATQFFEFVGAIAGGGTHGTLIHLPPALMQPIAAEDVAAAVVRVALEAPINGVIEIAGPEPIRQDALVRQFLAATGDTRRVVTDPQAGYFGATIDDASLTPTPGAQVRLGSLRFADWLKLNPPAHR